MDALNSSTRDGGLELINKLWIQIKYLQGSLDRRNSRNWHNDTGKPVAGRLKCDLSVKEVADAKSLMIYAAHRLTFLEMVTKGLSYKQMHDAQAYARFVDSKRELEDMDMNDLRELLR